MTQSISISQEILQDLPYDDFKPFAGYEEDAEVAAGASCDACGHEGLQYHPFEREDSPWRRTGPGSVQYVEPCRRRRMYIAVVLCPKCQHQELM